jgi:hypothetical protein
LQRFSAALGKSTEANSAACELLEKADKLLEKARRHAAQIAASADDPDPDDGDNDADIEPAHATERRKRLIEIASKASSTVGVAVARRTRAIQIGRLVHSA